MADSIKELILKHVVATLEGIQKGNGYMNDLAKVHRFTQAGYPRKDIPLAVVNAGMDTPTEGPMAGGTTLTLRELEVEIVVATRQDQDIDPRSSDEILTTLEQDVTKAMLAESGRTRGGYAITTNPGIIEPVEVEEKQPEIATNLHFHILYRHRRDDPTALQ